MECQFLLFYGGGKANRHPLDSWEMLNVLSSYKLWEQGMAEGSAGPLGLSSKEIFWGDIHIFVWLANRKDLIW